MATYVYAIGNIYSERQQCCLQGRLAYKLEKEIADSLKREMRRIIHAEIVDTSQK